MIAAYKLRAVPINVNYRYVPAELRALFADADLRALIVHRAFAPRTLEASEELPLLRTTLVVEDGSRVALPDPIDDYETALAYASEKRDFSGRSADDLYIVYTGGTTGRPKGVMWRHENIFFADGRRRLSNVGPIRPGLAARIPTWPQSRSRRRLTHAAAVADGAAHDRRTLVTTPPARSTPLASGASSTPSASACC
jgi:acyl-CoA synthetase (AMP-forming)/AMP-acid ligase II